MDIEFEKLREVQDMSVVKINAISVPEGKGAELEARFGSRVREVEHMEGFESFELLRPVKGEDRYFVYTRWRSEEDFQRWINSEEFSKGHARREKDGPVATHATLLSFEVVEWPGAGAGKESGPVARRRPVNEEA